MALTEEEERLIGKHLKFYRSLATGLRKPATPEQQHFVSVTLGYAAAQTPHERAYIKWKRSQRSRQRAERDPESEGPTNEWFSREDWKKMRGRQRSDGR